jgi:sec-independent protein translocase protein TatA
MCLTGIPMARGCILAEKDKGTMGLFDSPTHLLIILAVLVVLFGSAKLPKAAKSMGEAMRIFKKESAKLHEEDSSAPQQVQEWAPQQVAPPQPQVTPQQTAQEQQMAALQQQMDALKQQQTAAQQPPVTPPPAAPAPQPETQHTNQSS